MRIFVDTSAFYALEDSSDKNHGSAGRVLEGIVHGKIPTIRLYTSNYVFDETVTLLRSQLSHEAAIEWGERIKKSRLVSVLRIDEEAEEEAWSIFKKFGDKDFSFTDCTSFALMKCEEIDTCFTFDEHFKQFGFKTIL